MFELTVSEIENRKSKLTKVQEQKFLGLQIVHGKSTNDIMYYTIVVYRCLQFIGVPPVN